MEDEINLIDYIKVIYKYRFLVIGVVIISLAWTLLTGGKATKQYTATVTLIQAKGNLASGEISRALAGLSLLGDAQFSGRSDLLMPILESKTIAKKVVEDLDLVRILFARKLDKEQQTWLKDKVPSLESAANIVRGLLKSSYNKSGALELTVSYSDPVLAAKIANSYARQLIEYMLKNNFGSSLIILDPAVPVNFPVSNNNWLLKLLASFVLFLFVGIFLALCSNYLRHIWEQLMTNQEN